MRRFLIAITMASVTASAQTFRMNEAGSKFTSRPDDKRQKLTVESQTGSLKLLLPSTAGQAGEKLN